MRKVLYAGSGICIYGEYLIRKIQGINQQLKLIKYRISDIDNAEITTKRKKNCNKRLQSMRL